MRIAKHARESPYNLSPLHPSGKDKLKIGILYRLVQVSAKLSLEDSWTALVKRERGIGHARRWERRLEKKQREKRCFFYF